MARAINKPAVFKLRVAYKRLVKGSILKDNIAGFKSGQDRLLKVNAVPDGAGLKPQVSKIEFGQIRPGRRRENFAAFKLHQSPDQCAICPGIVGDNPASERAIEFIRQVFLLYRGKTELDGLPAQGIGRQCGHSAGQHGVSERKAEEVFKEGGVGKDKVLVMDPHQEGGITQFGL